VERTAPSPKLLKKKTGSKRKEIERGLALPEALEERKRISWPSPRPSENENGQTMGLGRENCERPERAALTTRAKKYTSSAGRKKT